MTYYKLSSTVVELSGTITGETTAVRISGGGHIPAGISTALCQGVITSGFFQVGWTVTAETTGGTPAYNISTNVNIFSAAGGGSGSNSGSSSSASTVNLAGSWSGVVVCDICLATTNPQTGTGALAPFWGRIEDTPVNTDLVFVLIPQPTQTFTVSISVGGVTTNVTGHTGSSPDVIGYAYTLEAYTEVHAFGGLSGVHTVTATTACTVTVTTAFPALSSIAGLSKSVSAPDSDASATTGIGYIHVDAFASGVTSTGLGTASSTRNESGDRPVSLGGQVGFMRYQPLHPTEPINLYPTSLVANINGLSGATTETFTGLFSRSHTQKQASNFVDVSCGDDGSGPHESDSNTFDDYAGVSASLTEASLVANGDDPIARRLMMRGLTWSGATLGLAYIFPVCAFVNSLTSSLTNYAGTWSISGGGSVSVFSYLAADGITTLYGVQFSGSGCTLTFTYTTRAFYADYRYMLIYLETTGDAKPLTFAFGDKEWDVVTAPAHVDQNYILLDLCFPTNRSATTDGTDTRWPEDGSGYPQEGDYFGVGTTPSFVVKNISGSDTYKIKQIYLVPNPKTDGDGNPVFFSDMDFIPSLGYWVSEKPDSGGTTYETSRFLHLHTDHVGQAVDEPALRKQTSGGGTSYDHVSIGGAITRLANARYPGITVVDTIPPPTPSGDLHPPAHNEFFNSGQPVVHLCGGGLEPISRTLEGDPYFTPARGKQILANLGSGVGIPAWHLFDSISEWFPGLGDVFGFRLAGESSEGLVLRCGTILRGYGLGIVANEDHVPVADIAVNLLQSMANRGSAISSDHLGIEGNYRTGPTFSRSGAASLETADDTVSFTAYTRKRQRAVFLTSLDDHKGLAALASPAGWYALAAVETASGTTGIRVRRCDYAVPDVPSGTRWPVLVFATTHPADTWPALALDPWGKLWLLYERAGVIYRRSSDDEGATWSTESMAFSSGKFPDQDSDPMTGTLLRAAVVAAVSGGGYIIKGQVQHAGDANPSAEFTFQYHNGSALADLKVKRAAFRLECGYEVQGRWNLALIAEGEADVSYWWCADGEGRTWTRIT